MDKRREKNLQVKAKITKAMFQLMKVKSLNDITITELIRVAGVARVSFYRNYDSKEDVLVKLIQGVLEDFRQNIHEVPEGLYSYDNIYLCFCYFEQYKNYVLDLCRSGFAMAILEELNRFHESMEGIMPSSSIERYTLYMYIGALFDTAVIWLSEENPVTTEEITAFFYQKSKRRSSEVHRACASCASFDPMAISIPVMTFPGFILQMMTNLNSEVGVYAE